VLGAVALLHFVVLVIAADITTSQDITIPVSMFRIEKNEVGYYGTLVEKYRGVPVRYPSWRLLHDTFSLVWKLRTYTMNSKNIMEV